MTTLSIILAIVFAILLLSSNKLKKVVKENTKLQNEKDNLQSSIDVLNQEVQKIDRELIEKRNKIADMATDKLHLQKIHENVISTKDDTIAYLQKQKEDLEKQVKELEELTCELRNEETKEKDKEETKGYVEEISKPKVKRTRKNKDG